MPYLSVALGGVLGAVARFALGGWILRASGGGFPWATLGVNLLGCVLLGALLRALPAWGVPEQVRLLLTVGFCGSFTTFSTFGWETLALLERGQAPAAAAYVLASVVLGVAGVAAGVWLGGLAS